MSKLPLALVLLVCSAIHSQQPNENPLTASPPPVASGGQNKFGVFGDATMTYTSNKDEKGFGDVNFKPIFLWKIGENLFVEAETEIETGDGTVNFGLEYANMCLFVNRYLTLHAGRFLPKFGAYRGRLGEDFLNRFPTDPVGFGDGGIGAMNEVGVGAQGGFEVGVSKISYDLYVSNGPVLLTDPENAGQFDYEAYVGNNKGKAIGGRIGFLPLSNSSLELGFSYQSKKQTGEEGSPYANIGVTMEAVDLNYYTHLNPLKSDLRIMGEWKHQQVDNATYYKADSSAYTFNNTASAFYVTGAFRPAHVHNAFIHNLELAARYSEFKRPVDAPWGGGDTHQLALSLDYWLHWNSVLKFTYQDQKDEPKTFLAQIVFGF
jgi:hypothetical protein